LPATTGVKKMKMTKEHYDFIKIKIGDLDRNAILAHRALGLGVDKDKRFVWDLWRAIDLSAYTCDVLYLYLNDVHIETALKRIAKELELI